MLWGDNVSGYVFCNIQEAWIVTGIKFLLTFELLCSIPLVLKPNIEIIEKNIGYENGGSWQIEMKRNVVRISMVFVSFGLTMGVPVFQTMLGLVGGVAASLVGFVIPPVVHLKLIAGRTELKDRKLLMTVDVFITLIGVGIMCWTAYSSIMDIISPPDGGNDDC